MGTLHSSLVHPREVFKAAILSNAAGFILAHNHPSGELTPSKDDIAVTERIKEAGDLLGIDLLDHIIVGDGKRYTSFREQGLM
jgi:DNA repair protein RadC